MFQRDQIGQPQRRQAPFRTMPACRESPQITVRKGQHHQIRRRLPQILGQIALVQSVAFAKDDMHGGLALQHRADRGFVHVIMLCDHNQLAATGHVPQGRSNWLRTRSPAACTSRRIGLS